NRAPLGVPALASTHDVQPAALQPRGKSRVLITHQTQNRQQLRLRETLRRKTMTVRRHNFAAHFQRHTGKRHKSNFTHASPIYTQLQIVQVTFSVLDRLALLKSLDAGRRWKIEW